jgi:hypothetical protein|nr:MAG TPA: hypothetical protein [Caudoviricetes sp.]
MKRIERPPVMDSSARYREGETYRMLVQEMDAQGRFCTVVRKVRLIKKYLPFALFDMGMYKESFSYWDLDRIVKR